MLEPQVFAEVVRNAPLISIDLIVRDSGGRILLGRRRNAPAQGYWFVPGGRIFKNETLARAFDRLCREELGITMAISSADFLGCFEHFYADNFAGIAGIDTHYVVLAYMLSAAVLPADLPDRQHDQYRWFDTDTAGSDPQVHVYTRNYFSAGSKAL